MRITNRLLALACAALIAMPGAVLAQPEQPRTPVPDREWYPEGYHDLRVAAALHAEAFGRSARQMLHEDFDNPGARTHDLIDCDPFYDIPEGLDEAEVERMNLALEVAKMRNNFAVLGYPPEVYDQPLLDYERAHLTQFVPAWARRLRDLEAKHPEGAGDLYAENLSEQEQADMMLLTNGMLGALKDELETRRKRVSPRAPRFVVEGGCGAGESEFEIRMVPANGELWLINAFAFRVCERKVADPWNHQACSWNQYGEGDNTFASGRYMYEARWPDGTVKRGTRVLEGGFEEDETVITFRR